MDNFAFVIFSPDSIVTGVYREAIKLISAYDIDFFYCKWLKIKKEQVEMIYAENYKISTFNNYLVEDLFSLDYSLVCILRSDSNINIIEFLKDYKGPSNPLISEDDKLRNILGAENKILNFIHTSDSRDDALREAKIFFPLLKMHERGVPPEPKDIIKRRSISIWYVKAELRLKLLKAFDFNNEELEESFEKVMYIAQKKKKTHTDINQIIYLETEQNSYIEKKKYDKKFPYGLFKELGNLQISRVDFESIDKELNAVGVEVSKWDKLIINCHNDFLNATKKYTSNR